MIRMSNASGISISDKMREVQMERIMKRYRRLPRTALELTKILYQHYGRIIGKEHISKFEILFKHYSKSFEITGTWSNYVQDQSLIKKASDQFSMVFTKPYIHTTYQRFIVCADFNSEDFPEIREELNKYKMWAVLTGENFYAVSI